MLQVAQCCMLRSEASEEWPFYPFIRKMTPKQGEFPPVSVLPITSKANERILHDQLSAHFEIIFDPYLAAFRKGYEC